MQCIHRLSNCFPCWVCPFSSLPLKLSASLPCLCRVRRAKASKHLPCLHGHVVIGQGWVWKLWDRIPPGCKLSGLWLPDRFKSKKMFSSFAQLILKRLFNIFISTNYFIIFHFLSLEILEKIFEDLNFCKKVERNKIEINSKCWISKWCIIGPARGRFVV